MWAAPERLSLGICITTHPALEAQLARFSRALRQPEFGSHLRLTWLFAASTGLLRSGSTPHEGVRGGPIDVT